jgi:preprotein translocase subunit SecF
MQIVGKTNIDFIGLRKYAWAFSGIMLIIGIISVIWVAVGQADLSIDFSGGTLIEGAFAQPINVSDLRSALSKEGFPEASIQAVLGGSVPNTYNIKVKVAGGGGAEDESVTQQLQNAIKAEFPDNKFTLDSVQEVGPTVGHELQTQAQKAVLIALVGILIYIWIRFDFRFSVAATICTFHDVLVVLGFMFLLHREISLLVISALLTLAGYSLTDTVVVFDRIRENLRMFRKRGDYVGAVNGAINDMLSRTIITSLTTFIAVLVVLFLCGSVVRDFALALTFGVVIGTYSSVFVASPIVVEWEARSPKRFVAVKK